MSARIMQLPIDWATPSVFHYPDNIFLRNLHLETVCLADLSDIYITPLPYHILDRGDPFQITPIFCPFSKYKFPPVFSGV